MRSISLRSLGIINTAGVYRNMTPAELTEEALRRGLLQREFPALRPVRHVEEGVSLLFVEVADTLKVHAPFQEGLLTPLTSTAQHAWDTRDKGLAPDLVKKHPVEATVRKVLLIERFDDLDVAG